jgi:S-DNA-T family DNA segregation ATPase FtsK/SpoIIIE
LAGQRYLVDAPVTVDVASAPIVAVVGKPTDGVELAASMVVQSAHLYSPADLVIAAALRRRHPATRWLGWLPHTRSPSSPLPGQHIGTAGDAERVLHELLSVADRRVTNERAGGVEGPRLLVLIDAGLGLDPPLVASLLNVAPAARISVLWLADDPDRVPWQTALTIGCRRLIDEQPSIVSSADPATHDQPVEIDRLPHDQAMTMARTLASFRDAQVDDRSGRLPIVASLGDALSVDRIDERWVGERWQRAQRRSLSVPIGVTATGPFVIDLVGHGPHGLIGGTSGSGKSELLTSLVAGLIACHPPTDVNVLFIDYKGGSSSDPFVDAPHTVGCVTNLDAFLARRALASLRAELNRRMALLAGRAKDLAELVERCPADAPPALVIVVDELAALVQDVPEFVAGLVDIAQRGRSLGIHLLLATQRPAGVVNDNILANTNLRIALRMLDGIESTGLIGSSDAASIPTEAKGRAFGRIGTHAPVVFQSAWSAAPSGQRQPEQQRISVRPLIGDDRPTSSPHDKGEPPRNRLEERDRESTQLDDVLAAVTSAAATHLPTFRARRPWHDELPAELTLEAVRSSAVDEPSPIGVVVGLLDEPDQQRQGPAVIDLAGGGLAVFGTGGSGKSTTLRTLALSAALDDGCGRGGDLTVFGLDFGSRDLASVAQLPQCAEIAAGDDLEAVTRIIGLLDRVVRERRSTKGNLAESNPTEGWPTVLLLIDDYGNLATTFEGAGASATLYPWFETLNRVIVDGRQLGIRTALTATRRAVVRAGVLSALTNRIVLGQAEAASYVEFGLPSSLHQEELVPGRGFLNATTQIQIAHTGSGVAMPEVDPAPVNATLWSRALPAELRLGDVTTTTTRDSSHPRESVCTTDDPSTRYSVVLGIADLALPGEVVTVDLGAHNLAVVGDPTSGRSTALGTIAGQLATSGVDVWAIGPTGSPLELLPHLHRHAFGNLEAVAELLCELVAAENGAAKPAPVTGRGPVLLVDDLDLLDRPALERSFGQVCEVGVRWVAATATLRTYSTNPLVQHLRRARSQLWLRPGTPRDIQEITGVAPTVRPGLPMPPGRGVLIVDRRATVLQVAR